MEVVLFTRCLLCSKVAKRDFYLGLIDLMSLPLLSFGECVLSFVICLIVKCYIEHMFLVLLWYKFGLAGNYFTLNRHD